MKPIAILSALTLPLFAAEPNKLSPQEKTDGFKLIFDGRSLDGFRGFKKDSAPEKWQVKDGAITLTSGGAGDLITTARYADFELRFEFKIAGNGNSGVMWRVTEDAAQAYESGPEFQILDSHSKTGYPHEIGKGNVSGALYDLIPAKPALTKPAGEWNEAVIRIEGSRITLKLNGTTTADIDTAGDDWKTLLGKSKFADWGKFNKVPKGHIAFQDHGDAVSFRSLRIKEL